MDGPRDLLVDICRRADTAEGVIHLINIGHLKSRTAAATLTFRWPAAITAIRCLRYDEDETPVSFGARENEYTLRIDGIREHAVVVIES